MILPSETSFVVKKNFADSYLEVQVSDSDL